MRIITEMLLSIQRRSRTQQRLTYAVHNSKFQMRLSNHLVQRKGSTRPNLHPPTLLNNRNRLFDLDKPAEPLLVSHPSSCDVILYPLEPRLVRGRLDVQVKVFDGVEGWYVET